MNSSYCRNATFYNGITNAGGIIVVVVTMDNVRFKFFQQTGKGFLDTRVPDLIAGYIIDLISTTYMTGDVIVNKNFQGKGVSVSGKDHHISLKFKIHQ